MIQEQSNMCVFVCIIPQLLCRNKMRFELKSTLLKYLVSRTLFFTFAKRLTTYQNNIMLIVHSRNEHLSALEQNRTEEVNHVGRVKTI